MRQPFLTFTITILLAAPAAAQAGLDTVRIQSVAVAEGVHMLIGSGGNMAVSTGEDAVFLVDDEFAPLSDKIVAAIRAITDQPVKFLVNTHWHFDHTGGNENFGKAGVVIVAHDNVRQRMSIEQFMARFNLRIPPSPKPALPVITFNDAVTFHLNGDDIHVVHVERAHTDGDALVHWTRANVIHMGDVFFNGRYPFIDMGSGGSIEGMIKGVGAALEYVNDSTRIIPGHGPLARRADLLAYRAMLVGSRDAVKQLIDQGRSREAIIAAKPTARWDAAWGTGSVKPEEWVASLYESLTAGR